MIVKPEKIDLERSKIEERIYLKKSFADNLVSHILLWFVIGIFPMSVFYYYWENDEELKYDEFGFIMSVLASLTYSFLIFMLSKNANELKRIKGKNQIYNRSLVLKVLVELDMSIDSNQQDIIIASLGYNNEMYIIFDVNDILINCTQRGRRGASFGSGHILGMFDYDNFQMIEAKLIPLLQSEFKVNNSYTSSNY